MVRALIGTLVGVVLLSPLPLMARGGGGHGGGGHCGGAHGGHGGAAHGGSFGPHHGCVTHCGRFFGGGGYWGDYLDRVGPTPGYGSAASAALDAGDRDEIAPKAPLSPQEEAQYRYDHRSGGD